MHFSKMLFPWRKHEHSQNPNLIHIALRILIQFSVEQDLRSFFSVQQKLEHFYIKWWLLNAHMGIEMKKKHTKNTTVVFVYTKWFLWFGLIASVYKTQLYLWQTAHTILQPSWKLNSVSKKWGICLSVVLNRT